VDEVLAVGDAEFQKKCLGKMGDVAHEGRTVLFVSHNMSAISTLTSTSIVLSEGHKSFEGNSNKSISFYLKSANLEIYDFSEYRQSGSKKLINLKNILVNEESIPVKLEFGQNLDFKFTMFSTTIIHNACITVLVKDKLNQIISAICSYDYGINLSIQPGTNIVTLLLPATGFSPGLYSFDFAVNPNFVEHWIDCYRGIPLGEVVIPDNNYVPSLISPHRTWGTIHYFDAKWIVSYVKE